MKVKLGCPHSQEKTTLRRGLCDSCYMALFHRVKRGQLTWQKAVDARLCLPTASEKNPMFAAVEEVAAAGKPLGLPRED